MEQGIKAAIEHLDIYGYLTILARPHPGRPMPRIRLAPCSSYAALVRDPRQARGGLSRASAIHYSVDAPLRDPVWPA